MGHATVGVLGGMGPAAGLHFAQQLIALNTAARQDADHVSFILHSDPQIPSRVDAFLKRTASPVPALVASLRKLEALGADFGVIVCNTAHIHFDEIAAQVRLPLIHMIDNAAQHADGLAPKCAKVVLFATAATVKAGLYRCHFGAAGVEIVTPTDEEQALVTAAIFDPETGIKATGMAASPAARQNLAEAAHRLRARTDARHPACRCTWQWATMTSALRSVRRLRARSSRPKALCNTRSTPVACATSCWTVWSPVSAGVSSAAIARHGWPMNWCAARHGP